MIELQPKQSFQANESITKEWRQAAQSGNFQVVMSYALAEFVMQTTPSAEQLAAVRMFIMVLTNLAAVPEKQPLPLHLPQLDHTALSPRKPPTEEK